MKNKKHKPEQIIRKLREADTMLALGKSINHYNLKANLSRLIPSLFAPKFSFVFGRMRCYFCFGCFTGGRSPRSKNVPRIQGMPKWFWFDLAASAVSSV